MLPEGSPCGVLSSSAFIRAWNRLINQAALRQSPPVPDGKSCLDGGWIALYGFAEPYGFEKGGLVREMGFEPMTSTLATSALRF